MVSPSEEVISPDSPLQSSISSLSGGGMFLPHRPMSAGIDGITQGFRFTAPGRKHSTTVVAGAGVQEKGIGNNDVMARRVGDGNPSISGPDGNRMEALKVSVPIFSPSPHSLSHNSAHPSLPPHLGAVSSFAMHEEQMLPPSSAPHPSERGRNNSTAKEKRKRIDSSSSLRSGSGSRDRSGHGSMVVQADDGGCGLLKRSGARGAETRELTTRTVGRRVEISGTRTPSHERGPKKKRQERLVGPSGSPNVPSPSGNSSTEVIVLDDDIKAELVDVNTLMSEQGGDFSDHAMGPIGPEHGSEKDLQNEEFQMHTDQPAKHHTLQPKDGNRRIGARPDTLNGRANLSNSHLGVGVGRINDQSNANNRSNVSNGGALKKKRPGNVDHAVGHPSQQLCFKATIPSPIIPPFNEERGQSSSSEHKLLMALTTLTTEKQSLENKLHETMASLKTQAFRTEISESKNTELETQVNTYRNTVSGLKKRMLGVQKFVDGLGKDYDMLNEKKTQLSNRLNELSRDRNDFLKSLQDVRSLAEKIGEIVKGWGDSGAILKEAYREIEKLNGTLKFLHAQLSENAGLLATERDRTQSLECQIKDDRERNKAILAVIQGGKAEIMQKLKEIREVVEKNEFDLTEKLVGTQKGMEARIEVSGEATRSLVHRCFKCVETLRDRDVKSAECLLSMEKKVIHTSDCIMGLFHETHKMNAEALSFTDGYISHLDLRIVDLEAELKGMHEKYEISLVVSAEKEHLEKELESKLEAALKKCNEMNRSVEKGKAAENTLNESISLLKQKLSILEPRSMEDSSVVETVKALKQRNCNLEKECELVRNGVHDASLSLQIKGAELENLKIELETLAMKHKEAEEKIERFAKEREEFMARAEEKMMKERIEVETNANMFRQKETSRLNNQIKALEAQKGKLEVETKELKTTVAGEADVTAGLRKEIAQFSKQYADIETSNFELLREKARLEKMVNNLAQPGATASMGYLVLEKPAETTTDELSKALGGTNVLQGGKRLMLQEMYTKEQELECTKPERSGFQAAIDSTGSGPNTVTDPRGELRLPKNDTEWSRGEVGEIVKEYGGLPRDSDTKEQSPEIFRMDVKTVETSWENTLSLSPSTPLERVFETQIGHDMQRKNPGIANINYEFIDGNAVDAEDPDKDVPEPRRPENFVEQLLDFPVAHAPRIKGIKKGLQDSQPRKNLATKFASKRRPPSTVLYSDDDETMIESFSDDDVGVDVSLSRNTYSGDVNPTSFASSVRTMEEKDNKNGKRLENSEGMLTEGYIPNLVRPSNRPKTPLRNGGSQMEPTDDGKKIQYRLRKEHGKKNRDDQEWKEDGSEPQGNNKGKGEAPNTKKNLRSYKERKKGGKRFL